MTKNELNQWWRLNQNKERSNWEYQELIRLNHLVMEVAHEIHNTNMMKDFGRSK